MILTGQGKHRVISRMSSVDRLLVRALHQVLQEPFEEFFSEYSFAYRRGKGIDAAVKYAADFISKGKEYVAEMDIEDFFDNIQHKRMLDILHERIQDKAILNLLEKYIVCKVEYDCEVHTKNRGLVQGNALNPLLSNLYLTEFDFWMEEQGYAFTRFADNINIYVEQMREGYEIFSVLFENKEKKAYILIETATSINIYSDVILSSTFLKLMMQRRLNVNLYDSY